MEDGNHQLKQIISLIIKSGYQLDAQALAFLKDLLLQGNIEDVVKKTIEALEKLSERPLFLTKEFLEVTVSKIFEDIERNNQKMTERFASSFKPFAKEVEAKIEVLYNPAERVSSAGSIESYLSYFRDRLAKIERILKERIDVKDAISIDAAQKAAIKSKVKVIGIVTEKRERRGSVFIRIEDYESTLTVLLPLKGNRNIVEKSRRLFIDQVVCVEMTKIKDDLFIANDLISPDIPEKRINTATEQVYTAFTSDIHIGSNKFLNKAFDNFIKWLRGIKGNNHQREIAGRVKYVIIAGDLVDGIGVYPNQEKELAIEDIYEQYRIASTLLEEIPEYIEVIVIPGNHDATCQALPQPAILKKYSASLYNLNNVKMLGNPARVRLHDVDLLVYHGGSLDDIIGVTPDVTYQKLDKEITIAMKYFLKTRHLAPIYGSKTPIAPDPVDELVIDPPPDILHMGHVHVIGREIYRGTLLINSGTWQGQTDYQKKSGLIPIPGIVPVVNLKSFKVMPINFLS